MNAANGLLADHFDTEFHFDLFPDELDLYLDFDQECLDSSVKRERGQSLMDANEFRSSKRLKVEEVSDFLDVVMKDDTITDDFPMAIPSHSDESDIDDLLSIINSHPEPFQKVNEAPTTDFVCDHRIPLPSKKWLPHPTFSEPSTFSKKKKVKAELPLITLKRVHVEERSLSTDQKARHKMWVLKRKRCLTGFKGYKCHAKSLAAKNKVRSNGRFF